MGALAGLGALLGPGARLTLAGTPSPDIEQMDRLLADAYKKEAPGASVIVTQRGKVVFRNSYGMANLDIGIALSPERALPIGSVTKPFTAAVIVLLVQQGKLHFEDPLPQFFPGHPAPPTTVTIEHLLTHTSGIKSFTDLPAWLAKMNADPTVGVPKREVLEMVLKEPL